jgi:prefoldin subunit 5
MTDSTLIEILLAVLAVAIGVGSFLGATRASRAQSEVAIVNIDAQAYERAQQIYESAISTLERRVTYLEGQVESLNNDNDELRRELAKLRRENEGLRAQ